MEKIYQIEMNQVVSIESNIDVMRVPSGWIYMFKGKGGDITSTQFVPYANNKPTYLLKVNQ